MSNPNPNHTVPLGSNGLPVNPPPLIRQPAQNGIRNNKVGSNTPVYNPATKGGQQAALVNRHAMFLGGRCRKHKSKKQKKHQRRNRRTQRY